jgi:23S rRNA (cytidine1920-2'-O)/16S rRNA (cytidine1409-2'-O)-methyltransferase
MSQKQEKSQRLDLLLVEEAHFASREAARTAIMDGGILVNGNKVTKAGTAIKPGSKIEILSAYKEKPYVSRGGLKLEKALKTFAVDCRDKIGIDVGASTGGFTDCLLKHGAAFVYAVDVGYGQIDWSLRTSEKVKVLERTNIRNLDSETLLADSPGQAPELAVMDVSFISVDKTLPNTINLMKEGLIELVILVKPQFEAGRSKVEKGGVVRNKETHVELLENTLKLSSNLGLDIAGLTYSPIKGPSGNIEYLLYLTGDKRAEATKAETDLESKFEPEFSKAAKEVVEEAFNHLNKRD